MCKSTLRRIASLIALTVLLLFTLPASEAPSQHNKIGAKTSPMTLAQSDASARARLSAAYGQLPLSFEANRGQTDSGVKFLSRGKGYSLFLTSNEAALALKSGTVDRPQTEAKTRRPGGSGLDRATAPSQAIQQSASHIPHSISGIPHSEFQAPQSAVVRMKLVGANQQSQVSGLDELPGKVNYFRGNDPKQWRTGPRTAR
jgi:hypothetical protein